MTFSNNLMTFLIIRWLFLIIWWVFLIIWWLSNNLMTFSNNLMTFSNKFMTFPNKGNKLRLYCTHMKEIKWNRLENPAVARFCGIYSFTYWFARRHLWNPSWIRWVQHTRSQFMSWLSTLLSSSLLRLVPLIFFLPFSCSK
jgi:hypothetical protein